MEGECVVIDLWVGERMGSVKGEGGTVISYVADLSLIKVHWKIFEPMHTCNGAWARV